MKPYRIALVGLGDIAEKGHLPTIQAHDGFELVGLCDIRPHRRTLFEQLSGGVPAVDNVEALLKRDDLDAVVLALHPEVSVAVATEFLKRGIAVLDEKPLATNANAARELGNAIQESGTLYQLGFVFRYGNFASKIAHWIDQLGRVSEFQIEFSDERLDRRDEEHFQRITQILATSSVVNHEGSHFLDLVRFWSGGKGDYTVIKANAFQDEPDFRGPNRWCASLKLTGGPLLNLELSWLLPMAEQNRLRITAEMGILEVDLSTGSGLLLKTDSPLSSIRLPLIEQGWIEQLNTFEHALTTGQPRGATFDDGLAVLKASLACEAMAAIQHEVDC